MANDNPNILNGFATDENSQKEAIPPLLSSLGWSQTNPLINGMQLNTIFNQIFGYLNFLQSKGLSFWSADKSYVATASYIDIVRRGNKIYFAKQDSNSDPENNPLPKAPESNPDFWGILLDLEKPVYDELVKYALKNGSNQNLFKVKDAENDDEAVSKKQLDNAVSNTPTVPTGLVIANPTATVPIGYLECNGAAISRTTYSDLFAKIGTTYGIGDGSTTFNIPDLRGEFIRGFDNGRGVDSGRSIGSSQEDEFKSHTHSEKTFGNISPNQFWINSGSAYGGAISTTTGATGGSETRPRNIAMMYCIKY